MAEDLATLFEVSPSLSKRFTTMTRVLLSAGLVVSLLGGVCFVVVNVRYGTTRAVVVGIGLLLLYGIAIVSCLGAAIVMVSRDTGLPLPVVLRRSANMTVRSIRAAVREWRS